jgi:hypothetical protein
MCINKKYKIHNILLIKCIRNVYIYNLYTIKLEIFIFNHIRAINIGKKRYILEIKVLLKNT